MLNATRKVALKYAAAPLALVVGGISSAHAELPSGVSTAISGYQTDATTAIGLIMAAGVILWGLFKLGRKFGWV